jgi:glycerol-3-phosphate dehydrogenase
MTEYDVVILGGGSRVAGILQAAAAACRRALLIERLGLASGASTESEPRCRVAIDLPQRTN